jgi:D-glycero-D-manno-heptose 1,7-bisphosphate phosphatase
MKRPAIFFDRDNTLIVGNEYLGDPAQVQLMPGAASAVARARKLGFATVVISNQSGVARGFFDEDTVKAVNQRVEDLLLAENPDAIIDRQEFCPFHPQGTIEQYAIDSDLRKPKPGMIFKAAHSLALDLSRSWMVGDAPRDIEAGVSAGCRTILFLAPDLPASPAALEQPQAKADFVVATLAEAIDFIEKSRDGMNLVPSPRPSTTEQQTVSELPVEQESVAVDSAQGAKTSMKPVRTDALLEQILGELRKQTEDSHVMDFSVSKLLAGIVQIVAIAVAFLAYLYRHDQDSMFAMIFAAQFFQLLTIALLIMGRQR